MHLVFDKERPVFGLVSFFISFFFIWHNAGLPWGEASAMSRKEIYRGQA